MKNKHKNRKQKLRRTTQRKKLFITSLAVIFIGAIFTIFSVQGSSTLDLTIGNEKIPEEEFLQAMSGEKDAVTQYFHKKYGTGASNDFWLQEFDGETPYSMLADKTIESLSLTHAAYETAKDNGYVDSINYSDLLERFEAENEERAEKIKKGEPVYGLKEFPLEMFIEHELDGLQKKYMNDETNEGMSISEEEGRNYYEEHKDKMFVKHDDFEMEFIKIYYAALELEESEIDSLEEDLNQIYKELADGRTLGSALENFPGLEPYYEHMEISSEEVSSRAKEVGDVLELAVELENGESTKVIDQNGSLYLVRSIERVENNYVPYEAVKENIFKIIREERYDQIISEKAEEIAVTGDMEEVYDFVRDQLKQ